MNAPDPASNSTRQKRLEQRLLAAARARTLDERVPAGFARRVQSRLTHLPRADFLNVWIRGFCQALIPAMGCLAVVFWLQPRNPSPRPQDMELDSEAAEISLLEALDASTVEVEAEL